MITAVNETERQQLNQDAADAWAEVTRAESKLQQAEIVTERLRDKVAVHVGSVLELVERVGEQITRDEGRDVAEWTHKPGSTTGVRIDFHPGEKTQGLPWWFEESYRDETGVVSLRGTLRSWVDGDAIYEVEFGETEVQ